MNIGDTFRGSDGVLFIVIDSSEVGDRPRYFIQDQGWLHYGGNISLNALYTSNACGTLDLIGAAVQARCECAIRHAPDSGYQACSKEAVGESEGVFLCANHAHIWHRDVIGKVTLWGQAAPMVLHPIAKPAAPAQPQRALLRCPEVSCSATSPREAPGACYTCGNFVKETL